VTCSAVSGFGLLGLYLILVKQSNRSPREQYLRNAR
jgi:hypothetical protein